MVTRVPFKRLILRAVLRQVSPMVIRLLSAPDDMNFPEFHEVCRRCRRRRFETGGRGGMVMATDAVTNSAAGRGVAPGEGGYRWRVGCSCGASWMAWDRAGVSTEGDAGARGGVGAAGGLLPRSPRFSASTIATPRLTPDSSQRDSHQPYRQATNSRNATPGSCTQISIHPILFRSSDLYYKI